MKKLICFVFTVVFLIMFFAFISNGHCTDYYVSVTDGDDADSGLTEEDAWLTLAHVSNLSPDDKVYLNKGDEWKETFTFGDTGSDGSPITLTSYGAGAKPIINGSDLVATWSQYLETSIYSAACNWTTAICFENNTKLTYETWDTNIATTAAAMEAGEWTLDDANDLIYVWATDNADPDTHIMEAGARGSCIALNGQDYITIDDLWLVKSHNSTDTTAKVVGGIFADDGSTNITIQNCTIEKHHGYGIMVRYGTDWLIDSNTLREMYDRDAGDYAFGDGVYVTANAGNLNMSDNIDITNNTFTGAFGRGPIVLVGAENCDNISGNTFTPTSYYCGFHIEPNTGQMVDNIVLDDNSFDMPTGTNVITVYDPSASTTVSNITVSNNTIVADMAGKDAVSFTGTIGGSNVISGNSISGTMDDGLFLQATMDIDVLNNSLVGATTGALKTYITGTVTADGNYMEPDTWYSIYIATATTTGLTLNASNNICNGGAYGFYSREIDVTANLYNNVFYDNTIAGILYFVGTGTCKNNIVMSTDAGVNLIHDQTATVTFDHNAYYAPNDPTGIFRLVDTSYNTLVLWQTASSQDPNSEYADPMFRDAANNDFALLWGSPCINTGTDLGASYDDALDPRDTTFPYDTLDQDDYGEWEIGAFVYRRRFHIGKRIKEFFHGMGQGMYLEHPAFVIVR